MIILKKASSKQLICESKKQQTDTTANIIKQYKNFENLLLTNTKYYNAFLRVCTFESASELTNQLFSTITAEIIFHTGYMWVSNHADPTVSPRAKLAYLLRTYCPRYMGDTTSKSYNVDIALEVDADIATLTETDIGTDGGQPDLDNRHWDMNPPYTTNPNNYKKPFISEHVVAYNNHGSIIALKRAQDNDATKERMADIRVGFIAGEFGKAQGPVNRLLHMIIAGVSGGSSKDNYVFNVTIYTSQKKTHGTTSVLKTICEANPMYMTYKYLQNGNETMNRRIISNDFLDVRKI